jgi:hypothetical protein
MHEHVSLEIKEGDVNIFFEFFYSLNVVKIGIKA